MITVYKGSSVGVVVPAYNEERYVGRVIRTMPGFVDRVYVVDDSSTDGTWKEIRESIQAARESGDTGEAFERKWVGIRHDENAGVGGAILTGYERALEDGVAVTAVMAGDAQMNPDILTRIIDPVVDDRVEYAKASRFLRRESWSEIPRFRLVGNAMLTVLTRIASGYWAMTDSQNGYTAISHDALRQLDLDALYEGYGFANDLLVRLNVLGAPIADVEQSAAFTYEDWNSHIDLRSFVPNASVLLVRTFVWRLHRQYISRDVRATGMFYGLGAVGAVLATVRALAGFAGPHRGEETGDRTPFVGFVVSALVVGIAMVLDRATNEGMLERVYTEDRSPTESATNRTPDDPGPAED